MLQINMAARSRGNGKNFDWLRKACDLSPDGNPEKYGRPMKSAILPLHAQLYFVFSDYLSLSSLDMWIHLSRAGVVDWTEIQNIKLL